MKAPLTPEDKKSLRYECRPGILFGVGILSLGLIVVFLNFLLISETGMHDVFVESAIAIIVLFIVSSLISLLFTRKYLLDLKNKEKDCVRYIIQKKEAKMDYIDVTPNPESEQLIEFYDHYHLTIDNSIHEVDKQLFERANAGDEVNMHIAPVSGHVLKIELLR